MTQSTFYIARINGVIDYIDAHLAEPLDLRKLSSIAHCSPWHFHRLFQALTGETLAERVRRRRLETAAVRLLNSPPVTALNIALDVGFGSAEVFTRAFKAYFGVTPGAWRRGGFREWVQQRRQQMNSFHQDARATQQALDEVFREDVRAREPNRGLASAGSEMVVAPRMLDDVRVAYRRHIGPYGDPAIPRMWQRFARWCEGQQLPEGSPLFGVGHDSADVTAPDKCRYDACVCVDDKFKPQGEIGVQIIKGGLYACSGFRGTADQIYGAWLRLYSHWLPGSGYQPDDRPAVEAYGATLEIDPTTGIFRCDLCLPVRPL